MIVYFNIIIWSAETTILWVLKIPTIKHFGWHKQKLYTDRYHGDHWSVYCTFVCLFVLTGLKAVATLNGRTDEWVVAWQLNLQLKWNTISRKAILDWDLFCYIVKTCYELVEPNHFNDLLTFALPTWTQKVQLLYQLEYTLDFNRMGKGLSNKLEKN